jgi:uncharacterized protein YecT (DUF1311 family)
MKTIFFIIGLLFSLSCFSQIKKEAVEVTPQLQKRIRDEVEKQIPQFKKTLEKEKLNQVQTEFEIDTFKVERFMEKWIDLDYTDAGMSDGTYAGAKLYDSLLNKYYKKLLAVLKPDDKKVLIQAQKAWLLYRDSEFKLVETISKDEYSGGGTMQQLIESGEYLSLVKNRTISIFLHYTRATQSE